jgi:SRSO17 transposase
VENCDVGVFAGLGGGGIMLTGQRLHLPREWIDSPDRCHRPGILQEERILSTKAELALEMIRHTRRQRIRYHWVSFDGGYGKDPWLLRTLDRKGETWVADAHCDQQSPGRRRMPHQYSFKGALQCKPKP